jgi:hypothetical protein
MKRISLFFLLLVFGCFHQDCIAQNVAQPGFVTNEVMDANEFWSIIEKSRKNDNVDITKQKSSLIKILKRLDIKDIVKFNNRFFSLMDIALDTKLIGASNIINTNCNKECFINFRAWLIVQGKDVFEKIIVNPDELSEMKIPQNLKLADFQFCADDAFHYLVNYPIPLGLQFSNTPHGNVIDKDKLPAIFPKLVAKYNN